MTEHPPKRILDLIKAMRGNGPHAHIGESCLRHFWRFLVEIREIDGDVVELGCGVGTASAFFQVCLEELHSDKQLHCYDAFPIESLSGSLCHPPAINVAPRNAEFGISTLLRTFEGVGAQPPYVHAGWFRDTLETQLPTRIALVHVTCAFHESVQLSLEHSYHRMPPGAICVLDGYGLGFCPCVKRVSDTFFAKKPEEIEVTVSAAQALVRRLPPKYINPLQDLVVLPSVARAGRTA